MMKKALTYIILKGCAFLSVACGSGKRITTTVEVVSDSGDQISGALVHIAYPTNTPAETRGVWSKEMSDANGIHSFTGRVYSRAVVAVEKEGYYRSLIVPDILQPGAGGYYRPVDTHVQVILREIRDPVPMYVVPATVVVPEYGVPMGFDVFAGDWVEPHGKGTHTDMVLQVDGFFNDNTDRETTLTITFPNEGDGMMNLEPHPHSELLSPHVAPADGYESELKTTFGVRRSNIPPGSERYGSRTVGDLHVFRIRTELDSEGGVSKAFYGKIHKGIEFDGKGRRAYEDDNAYVNFRNIYINPNPQCRSLEFDVEAFYKELEGPAWRRPFGKLNP